MKNKLYSKFCKSVINEKKSHFAKINNYGKLDAKTPRVIVKIAFFFLTLTFQLRALGWWCSGEITRVKPEPNLPGSCLKSESRKVYSVRLINFVNAVGPGSC